MFMGLIRKEIEVLMPYQVVQTLEIKFQKEKELRNNGQNSKNFRDPPGIPHV